jgi:hypothetical protein
MVWIMPMLYVTTPWIRMFGYLVRWISMAKCFTLLWTEHCWLTCPASVIREFEKCLRHRGVFENHIQCLLRLSGLRKPSERQYENLEQSLQLQEFNIILALSDLYDRYGYKGIGRFWLLTIVRSVEPVVKWKETTRISTYLGPEETSVEIDFPLFLRPLYANTGTSDFGIFLLEHSKRLGFDLGLISTSLINSLISRGEAGQIGASMILSQLPQDKPHKLDFRHLLFCFAGGFVLRQYTWDLLEYAIRTSGPDGMENTGIWSPWWCISNDEQKPPETKETNETKSNNESGLKKSYAANRCIVEAYREHVAARGYNFHCLETLQWLEDERKNAWTHRYEMAKGVRIRAKFYLTERALIDLCLSYCFDLQSCVPINAPFWVMSTFR